MSNDILGGIINKAIDMAILNLVDGIVEHTSYEVGGNTKVLLEELSTIRSVLERVDIQAVIDELTYKINNIARKEDRCPDCFCDLDVKKYKEIHDHLDDKPIEYFAYYECESCGWNDRDDR